MKISILIPVFNGLKLTQKCLLHLQKVLSPNFTIIIIDDGSTDGTKKWIEENFNDVIVLEGDGGLWWSGAINLGVQYVIDHNLSDYILWWNNDIIPKDDYFEQVENLLPVITDKIVAGSKIYDLVSGKVWGMGGVFKKHTGKKFQHAYYVNDGEPYNKSLAVDWLPGMGTLAHISIFKEVGLIDDKKFPQYHGDLDFTLSARRKGYPVIVYPELQLFNDTGNTGVKKKENWSDVKDALTSIKSLYNIKKDILLYRKFTSNPIAYLPLFKKYLVYFGGFFKWQLLRIFNITK